MEKTNIFFKKEFVGLILTLGSLILTILALKGYISNSKLDPVAMSALIAPVGAGGLLFFGIRATEGYLVNKLNTPIENTTITAITQKTGDTKIETK